MPNNLNANPYYQAMQSFDDPRNSLEAAATLALAFEQARTADALETANLIALYSASDLANAIERSKWDHVLNQIKTRLGLDA
jgi:hypothetical protein